MIGVSLNFQLILYGVGMLGLEKFLEQMVKDNFGKEKWKNAGGDSDDEGDLPPPIVSQYQQQQRARSSSELHNMVIQQPEPSNVESSKGKDNPHEANKDGKAQEKGKVKISL